MPPSMSYLQSQTNYDKKREDASLQLKKELGQKMNENYTLLSVCIITTVQISSGKFKEPNTSILAAIIIQRFILVLWKASFPATLL